MEEKDFAELERTEDKYIIDLEDIEEIRKEIAAHMKPAYLDPKVKYTLISSVYLDSPERDFFKLHIYGVDEREKVRYRSYGPNGKWEPETYLEIKEKIKEEIHKYRIQLDEANLDNIQNGRKLKFNEELEELNSPLHTFYTLKSFINQYNKLDSEHDLRPVISINYNREAYGKGELRATIDTNVSYQVVGILSLTKAQKIKKSVNWSKVKKYRNKYDPDKHAILEIKHDENVPMWLQNLLNKHNLEPEKFSKYVWSSYKAINLMENANG